MPEGMREQRSRSARARAPLGWDFSCATILYLISWPAVGAAAVLVRSRDARSLPRLSEMPYACARVLQHRGDRALEPRRVAVARDALERIGTQALPQPGVAVQPQALGGEIHGRCRDQDFAFVPPAELPGKQRRYHRGYPVRRRIK